jgi:ABC-type glycerol-3-phosphate transport system permease component
MRRLLTYTMLLGWLAAVVLPIAWVFFNSFRSTQEITENPFGVPWLIQGSPYADRPDYPTPRETAISNFRTAWYDMHFSRFFVNSVIVTGVSLVGILACGALAAYALARFQFRGGRALYLFFIAGMMVPAQLILIPLFFEFSNVSNAVSAAIRPLGYEFRLHNSLTGLILIYTALSLPFTILILTAFFRSLPGALRESAIMDGASEWTVFRAIMLPLARPGLITAAIFNFIGLWNEYLFALVFVNTPETKTLPLGLAGVSIQAQYKTDYGLMFAGLVIVLIPTLVTYAVLQRHLTRGITVGALKG